MVEALKSKKLSKNYLRAIELKRLLIITKRQKFAHTALAHQPMPKAKQVFFDKLLRQVTYKYRQLSMELDELFTTKLKEHEIKALVATEGVILK